MKQFSYPDKSTWGEILQRPALNLSGLYDRVQEVLDKVRSEGDKALFEFEKTFDNVSLSSLSVTESEMAEAEDLVSKDLKNAIDIAAANIKKFHRAQLPEFKKIETTPGVTCWQEARPITKVGLYIPGGTAPLFSTVLMLAIPAKTAGCEEIVLCTPPDKEGKINPAILYAAKVGGSQAIAAMAYGTESVPKVFKIFGPGNSYVTAAKQLVSLRDVAIDMPAGPSEVEVIADDSSDPAFVAADMLSQAEHGIDSQALLVTTSAALIEKVKKDIAS